MKPKKCGMPDHLCSKKEHEMNNKTICDICGATGIEEGTLVGVSGTPEDQLEHYEDCEKCEPRTTPDGMDDLFTDPLLKLYAKVLGDVVKLESHDWIRAIYIVRTRGNHPWVRPHWRVEVWEPGAKVRKFQSMELSEVWAMVLEAYKHVAQQVGVVA